jgi:hypothetical protein
MGSFLTYVMETLRHQPEPKETEIDHNMCVCCGSVNVTEHETKSGGEESDGEHENALCR